MGKLFNFNKYSIIFIIISVICIVVVITVFMKLLYSGYMYSPPEDEMTDTMLNGYCLENSCYNNIVANSSFNSDFCNRSYCEVTKTLVPTLPDIDNNHWFFDYALYIGGVIHLLLSLVMIISYFLINVRNFVLPGFIREFLENSAKTFPIDSLLSKLYVCKVHYKVF